jgi:predicted nucleotidyltransferase
VPTLDLSHRNELDWLARLVGDVRSAVPGLEPLLVGALARDLLLHYGHGLRIERATRDVDLALAVADWNEYAAMHGALLASGVFAAHPKVIHKIRNAGDWWIDLIPFGAVEKPDGTIAWPPAGDDAMEVLGWAEAAAASIVVLLPQEQKARTVTLPMLAVLKVFAWSDRHRSTQGKDAVDLGLILRSYLEAGNVDRLYADFPQVITDRFDFEPTGAWLLGRDARETLAQHSSRFDRVIGRLDAILARELTPERHSVLAVQLNPAQPDLALRLLGAFHAGVLGAAAP